MNDMFVVAKFTMKDMLRRKSFIISTIIILLMIIIGCNIPNISKSFKGEFEKVKILISDKDNIFENKLNTLSNDENEIIAEVVDIDKIKDKLLNNDIAEAVIVEKKDNNINFKYIVKNAMYMEGSPYIVDALSSLYKEIQVGKLNLSKEEILSINPTINFEIEQAEEEANSNIFVMMMLSIVLFYAVYFCAFQVSSSITTEKTSKIIETLVTSTSPTNIVLGKTIGIGLVGLFQLVLIILTALFSVITFLDLEIIESVLDMSSITVSLGLITLLYFILGYSVYALLYALTGSTVSKPEDIQSANTPIAMITMIGFYLSYFTMMNPNSNMNMIAGLIPISSPFCMPFRIMMGFANTTEILISIGILLFTIVLIASITIKVYSNAILNYGSKMSIKDIIKMYKQK